MRGGKFQSADGADSEMMYDDSAFKIFAVAFLAVYWIPVALYRIIRYINRRLRKQTPMEKAKESWCVCFECQHKADRINAKKTGLKGLTIGDIIFIVVTILLVFTSVNVFRSNIRSEAPFDPFLILGVSKQATTKQVKKAYRKLSVLHHPDKNLKDREGAAERFLKISKAYAALTDDVAKENYKKYGNPDGYLGASWVIGLPEWISENSRSVLMIYAIFMVIVFPSLVGYWWHNSKQQLTPEIMTSTFMMYRETLMHTKRFRDLLTAFCGSDEFNHFYTTDNETALKELNESLRRIGALPKWKTVVEPSRSQIQNVMIMTAYLSRTPIPKQLHYVLEGILLRCEPLLTALTDTVGVFQRPDCRAAWDKWPMQGHTTYLARCLQLTQCINQALDEKSSPLLQIPHFTEHEVRFCTNRNGVTKSVYDIMRMDVNDLKRVLRDFSNAQLLDVKAFCDRFPVATLEVEPPKVDGEEDSSVHEGDMVTVKTTIRILRRSGSAFSPCTNKLPYKKEEVWWVWLADQERQCPTEVRRLLPKMARGHDGLKRKSGFDADDDEDSIFGGRSVLDNSINEKRSEEEVKIEAEKAKKKTEEKERKIRREDEVTRLAADPRVTVFEVPFKFMAPKAGTYTLEVKTACDCYAGASKSLTMTMNVKEAAKIEQEEIIYDTDEEDEDEESDDEETDDEKEEEEGDGDETEHRRSNGDGEDEDDDSEYEYIEVTASESEAGDFDDDEDDDDFGISGVPTGDPSAK